MLRESWPLEERPEKNSAANEDLPSVVSDKTKNSKSVYQTPGGWRTVLEDHDSGDLYTDIDIFALRWKARNLVEALEIALKSMCSLQNWRSCCDEAIKKINDFEHGWTCIKNAPQLEGLTQKQGLQLQQSVSRRSRPAKRSH